MYTCEDNFENIAVMHSTFTSSWEKYKAWKRFRQPQWSEHSLYCGCLGSSVVRATVMRSGCCGFKSRSGHLIFSAFVLFNIDRHEINIISQFKWVKFHVHFTKHLLQVPCFCAYPLRVKLLEVQYALVFTEYVEKNIKIYVIKQILTCSLAVKSNQYKFWLRLTLSGWPR